MSAAYLHRDINGEVYMDPPLDGESIWLLLKGLYGLKQAGQIWHEQLKDDMEELGFIQCSWDHAVCQIGMWHRNDCHSGWMTRLELVHVISSIVLLKSFSRCMISLARG